MALCLALSLCGWTLPALSQDWDVTAEAFVIMDARTGRVLLSLNPHKMLPPASTIKTMTAMYVRERLNLDDRVPVSPYAAAAPPSKIAIKPGETYSVRELLYALLLSSANDGARALAERVSGSERAFTRELTRKVREWGAYRTRVVTANGLTAEDQYSTAEDLAILFRRFTNDPVLAEIMGTKFHNIQGSRELRNHDRFLFTTPLALGGKTGYTRASKHTYVGRFSNGSNEIIVSMLYSDKKWADLRALIEKGFEVAGTPIARLEPREEGLSFARRHAPASPPQAQQARKPQRTKQVRSKQARPAKKSQKVQRKPARPAQSQVVTGSATTLPTKPKATVKRKSRSASGG
jgi:serine-type D-Ala-D-Ala carboxypeptidase (penicillin-binding protein 5/6)